MSDERFAFPQAFDWKIATFSLCLLLISLEYNWLKNWNIYVGLHSNFDTIWFLKMCAFVMLEVGWFADVVVFSSEWKPAVEEYHSGLRERWKHRRLRWRKFYFSRLSTIFSIFTIRASNSFCLEYGNILWLGVSNMQNRSSVFRTGDPSNSICRVKVDTLARRNIAAAGNNIETESLGEYLTGELA